MSKYKPKTTRIDRKRKRLLDRAWKYFYQANRKPPHGVDWLYPTIYRINRAWANLDTKARKASPKTLSGDK